MAISSIRGTAAVFGDHVSADVVLPARHSFLPPAQMAENVLLDVSAEANRKVRMGEDADQPHRIRYRRLTTPS